MHAWAFQKASLCMVGTHGSHTGEVYLIILCHRLHVATRILDCAISFMVGVFSALSSGCTVIMPFAGFVFLSVFSSSADTSGIGDCSGTEEFPRYQMGTGGTSDPAAAAAW